MHLRCLEGKIWGDWLGDAREDSARATELNCPTLNPHSLETTCPSRDMHTIISDSDRRKWKVVYTTFVEYSHKICVPTEIATVLHSNSQHIQPRF